MSQPKTLGMDIDERAAWIASALISARIGGTSWTKVRDRALVALREHEEWTEEQVGRSWQS